MVPTLSLLLDQPIPFSNLGTITPDFFLGPHHKSFLPPFLRNSFKGDEQKQLLASKLFQQINAAYASFLNCKQLFRFIQEYQTLSKDLPATKIEVAKASFEFLEEKFQEYLEEVISFEWQNTTRLQTGDLQESIEELNNIHNSLQHLLSSMKHVCRSVWAKFDIVSMTMGFTLMFFISLITLLSVCVTKATFPTGTNKSQFIRLLVYLLGLVLCGVGIVLSAVQLSEDPDTDSLIVFVCVSFSFSLWLLSTSHVPSLFVLTSLFWKFNVARIIEQRWFLPALFLFGQCLSLFSNSYIIYEDSVTLFICQTSMLLSLLRCILVDLRELKASDEKRITIKSKVFTLLKTRYKQLLLNVHNMKLLSGYLVCLVCLRVTKNFWFCREMQLKCSLSPYALPLVSLLSEFTEGHVTERLLVALVGMVIIVYITRYRLKKDGNLNGERPVSYIGRLIGILLTAMILFHWCLQLMLTDNISKLFDVQHVQQILLPRCVYMLFLLALIALIWNPLAIFKVPRERARSNLAVVGTANKIAEIYQHINSQFQQKQSSKGEEKPVVVYGLKTGYSSSIIALLYLLLLVACMVMTDGMVLPLACLWLAGFFMCKQFSIKGSQCSAGKCTPQLYMSWKSLTQNLWVKFFLIH